MNERTLSSTLFINLPLLEQKTGALDQAPPLVGWDLPEEFGILRRMLESRMGKRGKREFVQVLRLMENFRQEEVHNAIRDAMRLGAVSFDAIKHLELCRIVGSHRPVNRGSDLECIPNPSLIDARFPGTCGGAGDASI
jgi:hypothetical protein